ncbi:MAG: nucleotidyl transferase AbiEii/AbiGii toxin family protein [Paludibacteraceae bacterium]|nr:nucleotidyl transferase AbiEii/AbiGii toxin family protein [Paludibacteraceae bacterium]
MLAAYPQQTEKLQHNARIEVAQQIVVAGLARSDFFSKAAFYGGTCLRIFHNLHRFSEDMDFSLLQTDETFAWETYFPYIEREFEALGRIVTITKKDKRSFGKVESAFFKGNTEVVNLQFQTEKSLKVKIEVDTYPPLGFATEQRLLFQPYPFYTRCIVPSDLFAGKIHALLFRQWKSRVKGRDWYDFEWYIRHNVPLHFEHLQERVRQCNDLEITKEQFTDMLRDKITHTDISDVRADVEPFLIGNPHDLDIWSNEYFLQIANMIRFV